MRAVFSKYFIKLAPVKITIGLFIILIIFSVSCRQQKKYTNNFNDPILFAKTVKELNNVVKFNNFPPIVASRNYVYAAIAAYEVVAAGDEKFQSLAGQIKHLPPIPSLNKQNVNFQYATILAYCKVGEAVTFPEGSMSVYLKEIDSITNESNMPDDVKEASRSFADAVAVHILAWSKSDKYAETRTAERYTITNEEGRWIPTPPEYAIALEPHWNMVRPVVMDSANQFVPPRPPAFNIKDKNSVFYKEVMAVKNAGDSLTDEQKHIAMFWDDLGSRVEINGHIMSTAKKFSPPGHWMNIVGIAAQKSKADFSTTVSAYAKTAIAIFDAFIQCWDEKYRSCLVRPETAINKYIDPEWVPYLQTPPFPEYTCGHSTASASAAEALASVFGDKFAYVDTSELEFGIPSRSFNSFRDAAIENNWARFYGGIHYHSSCIISTEYGKKVGELVNKRLKMKK